MTTSRAGIQAVGFSGAGPLAHAAIVPGGLSGGGNLNHTNGVATLTATTKATSEIYKRTTGTFVNGGSMHGVRHLYTATLLNDGTILVAGGFNKETPLATAEIYHPASGQFTAVAGMIAPWQNTYSYQPGVPAGAAVAALRASKCPLHNLLNLVFQYGLDDLGGISRRGSATWRSARLASWWLAGHRRLVRIDHRLDHGRPCTANACAQHVLALLRIVEREAGAADRLGVLGEVDRLQVARRTPGCPRRPSAPT